MTLATFGTQPGIKTSVKPHAVFLRPVSDQQGLQWVAVPGGPPLGFWNKVDEVVADDTDLIRNDQGAVRFVQMFLGTAGRFPREFEDVVIRVRGQTDGASAPTNVRLFQTVAGPLRVNVNMSLGVGAIATAEYTLSDAEKASFTSWDGIMFFAEHDGSGGGPSRFTLLHQIFVEFRDARPTV